MKKILLFLMLIAPVAAFAQKFGHVRSMEIVTILPEYEKAQKDMQAMQTMYEDEMKRTADEMKKKYKEFQEDKDKLSENILARRQQELQELNDKAIQFQQDAQQNLQKKYNELMEPILKKVEEAIKAVGQEGGYVYIFDLNSVNIPWVNSQLSDDVTAKIKKKLGLK